MHQRPLASALADMEAPPLDLASLRDPIQAKVHDLRGWFGEAGEKARRALLMLLGDRRLEVHPDDEHGYRLEGFFELALNATTPRASEGAGVLSSVVAGTCFDGRPIYVPPLDLEVGFGRIAA